MRKGRVRIPLTVALVVALSFTATGAKAESQPDSDGQGGTVAECSLSFPAYISHGLGVTPSSVTFNSRGETGSIECTGTIYGHTVTGPGSFGFDGTLTDSSCLSHQGSGTSYFTIPTDVGPVRVSGGAFTITGVGVFGTVHAIHEGVHFTGSYRLMPVNGNCVTEPVTEGRVSMNGSIRDMPDAKHAFKCDFDAGIIMVNCRSGT